MTIPLYTSSMWTSHVALGAFSQYGGYVPRQKKFQIPLWYTIVQCSQIQPRYQRQVSSLCVCIKKGKKCLGQSFQMKLLKIWLKFLNTQSPLWINGLLVNLMPIVGFPFPLGFWPLKFSGTCSLLPSNIFCKPFSLTFSRYSWFASDQLHRKENFYKTIGVGWRIELILAERKGGDI